MRLHSRRMKFGRCDLVVAQRTSTFTVTIIDIQPPVITVVSVNPSFLWPPNHRLVPVTISYNVNDNCDPPSAIICRLTVSSNEPINGTGDGDTAPDWEIVDSHHVRLRAERGDNGSGRIYTIPLLAPTQTTIHRPGR